MLKPTADIDLIMMDSKGSTGAVTVHIPASSTIAIGDAVASALASLVAPMSDAVLIKYRISWRNGTDALSVAETGAAIKNAGVFVLCSDSSPQLAVLNIPGIKEEIFVTTGPGAGFIIDPDNSDVIALLDGLIAANEVNPFGEAVNELCAAYRQSRV